MTALNSRQPWYGEPADREAREVRGILDRGLQTAGGGNTVKLMSRLMVLIVGIGLVASVAPGVIAAAPPCEKLLSLQDVTKMVGPGFTRLTR